MTARRQARAEQGTAYRVARSGVDILAALADPDAEVWASDETVLAMCEAASLDVTLGGVGRSEWRDPCWQRFKDVRNAYGRAFGLVASGWNGLDHHKLSAAGIYSGGRSPFHCKRHFPGVPSGLKASD